MILFNVYKIFKLLFCFVNIIIAFQMIQSLQVAYEPPMQAMHAGKSISANEQIASHSSILLQHMTDQSENHNLQCGLNNRGEMHELIHG